MDVMADHTLWIRYNQDDTIFRVFSPGDLNLIHNVTMPLGSPLVLLSTLIACRAFGF
jgi:hypothetical protein